MRFLFSIFLWVFIVGGLWWYTWQRDNTRENRVIEEQVIALVMEEYSLELTPTFSVEEDPFALTLDEQKSLPLEVRVNGVLIDIGKQPIRRGETLHLEKVKHFTQGSNELHLKASPPVAEGGIDHGLRVRVVQAGAEIVDKTIWSSKGSLVSGTVSFRLETAKEEEHDH
jgi:hypothetical protein